MNEDMKIGTKIALEGVKEELIKVRAELKRKGREGLTYNLKCYYSSMN